MSRTALIYGNQEKWDSIPAGSWPQEIAKQGAFSKKYHQTGALARGYDRFDACEDAPQDAPRRPC